MWNCRVSIPSCQPANYTLPTWHDRALRCNSFRLCTCHMRQEEKDNFCNSVRPEMKQAGISDDPLKCWEYFLQKVCVLCKICECLFVDGEVERTYDSQVHENLHIVMCFSPVGNTLRNRVRQFPSLLGKSQVDCFSAWPFQVRCWKNITEALVHCH